MNHLFRKFFLALAFAASAFLVGCAGSAPNYSPSIDNVEALKKSGAAPLKTGVIAVTPAMPGATSLSLRANTMSSPVGGNYGDYLSAALRQELELAKLYNVASNVEVTGTLIKNNVDAGGMSTASGQMEARFVVKKNGQIRFDKVKSVTHQWESAFAGAVAIPAAANNYPVMVQKLLGALVNDADFVQAIRN